MHPGRLVEAQSPTGLKFGFSYAAGGNNFVSWSPRDRIELPLRAIETCVRGRCVAAEGQVMAEPGTGRFVSRLRMQ